MLIRTCIKINLPKIVSRHRLRPVLCTRQKHALNTTTGERQEKGKNSNWEKCADWMAIYFLKNNKTSNFRMEQFKCNSMWKRLSLPFYRVKTNSYRVVLQRFHWLIYQHMHKNRIKCAICNMKTVFMSFIIYTKEKKIMLNFIWLLYKLPIFSNWTKEREKSQLVSNIFFNLDCISFNTYPVFIIRFISHLP